MRNIAPEINLDYDKMAADSYSNYALCYLDPNFAYKNLKHQVDNLVIIGWLLSKHWSDETQGVELWHMLNPKLDDVVTKGDVMNLVNKLCYIAIDMNLNMIKNSPDSAQKKNALKYHERIAANRAKFLVELDA